MFAFPPQTAFGKTVPKRRFTERPEATARQRALFKAEIANITWTHKLSPSTL